MEQPVWKFELEPSDEPMDETNVNLRAYFDRMDDEKMRGYSAGWTDEEVIAWDDNFRDDGLLFLPCSERESTSRNTAGCSNRRLPTATACADIAGHRPSP